MFFFLFILLVRDRHGRIDFKWEEELQPDAHPLVGLMSFHMQSLSNEPECGKHLEFWSDVVHVTSKFGQPSTDFTPFWSYIQNFNKGNPSLPGYHATRYSEQLLTILAQPLHSVTSNWHAFACIFLNMYIYIVYIFYYYECYFSV